MPFHQFPSATPPDILRSIQKDESYLIENRKKLSSLFTSYFGTRTQMKYNQLLKWTSDLLYYSSTSLWSSSAQTLGEEYADIIPMYKHLPLSLSRKIAIILMLVFSPFCFRRAFQFLKKRAEQSTDPAINMDRVEYWKTFISGPLLSCQLALFYFTGTYYHVSRMIFGARYALLRKLRQGEMQGGYEILGGLIIIRLLANALSSSSDASGPLDYDDTDVVESSLDQCTLCLGTRKDSTAASCGHVYCWKCVADWIRTKPECPLCRQKIDHQTLTPLSNY